MKDETIYFGKVLVGGIVIYALLFIIIYLLKNYFIIFTEIWEFVVFYLLLIVLLPFILGVISFTYSNKILGIDMKIGFGYSWLVGMIYILSAWLIVLFTETTWQTYFIYINLLLIFLYAFINFGLVKLLGE